MPSQPRLRLASVIVGLALFLLPEAIAQIQSEAPPGLGLPSSAPAQNGTPTPPSAADPLGIFAPSSPDGLGGNDPLAPAGPGSSRSQGTLSPVQGAAGDRPADRGRQAGGAPPSAFGSLKDFSAELGIRQLIDPNSPDFQPLSVSDFHLLPPDTKGMTGQGSFRLESGATGNVGQAAGYRERFALILASSSEALSQSSGNEGELGGLRPEARRLAWPAIQNSCPASGMVVAAMTPASCPG